MCQADVVLVYCTNVDILCASSEYTVVSAVHMVQSDGVYDPYGLVFLFKRNPSPASSAELWEDTGLVFESSRAQDQYGASLALGREMLAVGAPADSQQNNHNGAGTCRGAALYYMQAVSSFLSSPPLPSPVCAVYIYHGADWSSTVTLFPQDGEEFSFFGSSIAVCESRSGTSAGASVGVGVGVRVEGGAVVVGAYGHYHDAWSANSG